MNAVKRRSGAIHSAGASLPHAADRRYELRKRDTSGSYDAVRLSTSGSYILSSQKLDSGCQENADILYVAKQSKKTEHDKFQRPRSVVSC